MFRRSKSKNSDQKECGCDNWDCCAVTSDSYALTSAELFDNVEFLAITLYEEGKERIPVESTSLEQAVFALSVKLTDLPCTRHLKLATIPNYPLKALRLKIDASLGAFLRSRDYRPELEMRG